MSYFFDVKCVQSSIGFCFIFHLTHIVTILIVTESCCPLCCVAKSDVSFFWMAIRDTPGLAFSSGAVC